MSTTKPAPVDFATPEEDPRVSLQLDSLKGLPRGERDLRCARVLAMLTEAEADRGKRHEEAMRAGWQVEFAEKRAAEAAAKLTSSLDATRDIHTALRVVRRIFDSPSVLTIDGKQAPDPREDPAYLRGLIAAAVVVIEAVL